MPTIVNASSQYAVEKSTFVVTAAFADADGVAVVPNSITWTLTDMDGTVINSRTAVAVAVPAASIDIVLSNNDLTCPNGERALSLSISAVYDSTEGSNLTLKDSLIFTVKNLVGVS